MFQSLRKRNRKSRRNDNLRQRIRPMFEMLEQRTLLSAVHGVDAQNAVAHPTFKIEHHAGLSHDSTVAPTGLSPAQMQHAYGVDNISFSGITGDGTGQTIAIIDAYDDPNAASDLHNFDTRFGLPDAPSFTKLNENGGTTLPGVDTAAKPDTWELEESLDIEWAHVIAPRASLILYEANSPSFSDLMVHAANSARNNPTVTVVSMSFGGGEFSGETSYDSYFTTPTGHTGVTFTASTGDSGSPGGYPAYSPNVVAVGGTHLSVDSSGNWLGETAWSGSGGGRSTQEAEPSYQNSVQSSGRRDIPDVAMDADPNSGVPVYDTFDNGTSSPWIQIGGTSLASPMFAGVIAIADQGRLINGLTALNGRTQTLPMLYQASAASFHDITSGNNGGFSAGVGYDLVTGRGSPVASTLINALAGTPTAPATSAAFVRSDLTTQGNWTGVYGGDGYSDLNGPSSLPSYATVTASNQQAWTWAASTTDVRGLQTAAGSTSRLAACYYSPTSYTLDVSLTDGQSHQVALYMVDWDYTTRAQTVQVTDAVSGRVLDTQNVSNFNGGQWLVWNLSGHVKITLTCTGSYNAVASGIMFGAPSQVVSLPGSATYRATDTTTQGNWTGVYGADGYWDFTGPSALPAYAAVSSSGQQTYTWAASTTDPRALQTAAGSSSRLEACFYSPTSFTLDVNLTDGQSHQVALYMADYDTTARSQTVQVTDAATGAVLDTRSVSNFNGGEWLVWNITGHVKITLTCTGGYNAVASGIMFGPAQATKLAA